MRSLKDIDFERLEKNLGIKIKSKEIFIEALTHKSYIFFHPDHKYNHNERLEFLGDAIIEFVVSNYLFNKYKNLKEGELTLIRASVVNREKLLDIAERLNLDRFILYEKIQGEKGIKTISSNCVEALVGAIFLDSGLEAAKNFIEKNFFKDLDEIVSKKLYKDPKSRLQEIFQERFKILPKYVVLKEEGLPHKKNFKIGIFLNDKLISVGEGNSKQEAEVKAAIKALKKNLIKFIE
ncbi:MAG: ribonuclease III [Minisyncoccia bacterium]